MENFKSLFEENGFPGLHTTKVAIEVVLRELCKTVADLEQYVTKYKLDLNNETVRKVYIDLHGQEMEAHGFTTVKNRKRASTPPLKILDKSMVPTITDENTKTF